MNQQVLDSLMLVINNWRLGNKNYTFEKRALICYTKSRIVPGEYEFKFSIHVNGFYEDITHQKEINLDFTSQTFTTQNVSISNPDNVNGDANSLESFLYSFTMNCYDQINDILATYSKPYTSDPLHMKGTNKRNE